MLRKLWNEIFIQTIYQTEKESRIWEQKCNPAAVNKKVVIVCLTVTCCITMNTYFGGAKASLRMFQYFGWESFAFWFSDFIYESKNVRIAKLSYWTAVSASFFLIVPCLTIKFVLKEKISSFGFKLRGALKDYKIFLVLLAIMFPILLSCSYSQPFQDQYPIYKLKKEEGLWPGFWTWQLLYLFRFICIEFFFRGFMIHGLKERFGYYAVFVSMIPYCMVHFGKPMAETFASNIAGIVLGTLSLKTGSIWLGIAIHYSVALTMDLAALWQKGYFLD